MGATVDVRHKPESESVVRHFVLSDEAELSISGPYVRLNLSSIQAENTWDNVDLKLIQLENTHFVIVSNPFFQITTRFH